MSALKKYITVLFRLIIPLFLVCLFVGCACSASTVFRKTSDLEIIDPTDVATFQGSTTVGRTERALFCMVPSLSSNSIWITVFPLYDVDESLLASGLNAGVTSTVAYASEFLAEQRSIILSLESYLDDSKPDLSAYQLSTGYLRSLDVFPFGVWQFASFAIPSTPRSDPSDVRLIRGFLDCLNALYGTNICIDTPVFPRLGTSTVQGEGACFLVIRARSAEQIEASHRVLLGMFFDRLRTHNDGDSGEVETESLVVLWSRFFSVMHEFGVQAEVLDVDVKRNIIILSATQRCVANLRLLFVWD